MKTETEEGWERECRAMARGRHSVEFERKRKASLFTEQEFAGWIERARGFHEDAPSVVLNLEIAVRAKLIEDLRPVFEAAARADQPLVEYHGRKLGTELVPLHGRLVG